MTTDIQYLFPAQKRGNDMYFSVLVLSILAFQEPAHKKSFYEDLSPAGQSQFVANLINLMDDEGLQGEMEIVPSQISEIKSRIKDAKETFRELNNAAQKKFNETGDQEALNRTGNALRRDYLRELEAVHSDILLPHQLEQLNQTVLWWIIKSDFRNYYNFRPHSESTPVIAFRSVLEHEDVKEILEIDETQARKLEKKSNELQAEFLKDFTALHEKYEKRLREDLTSEQRGKMKKVLGETPPFLFVAPKRSPGQPGGIF